VIQYAALPEFWLRRLGLLDTPLSRGMTAEPDAGCQLCRQANRRAISVPQRSLRATR
jgi:hypothetical protein